MSQVADFSNIESLFKTKYAPDLIKINFTNFRVTNMAPFRETERIGKNYEVAVIVADEQGYTTAAPKAGAYTLNNAIAMAMQTAIVTSYQATLRSEIAFDVMAQSQGKAEAFSPAELEQFKSTVKTFKRKQEWAMLYGQVGLGKTDSSVNVDATTTNVTFTAASWANGLWTQMIGAQYQFWQADNTLVSSGADSIFTVASVNVSTRTVKFTGTATGITALDTAIGAGSCDVFVYGARTGASSYSEMVGVDKIITNTGELFGIDASVYDIWRGNTYSVGGQLTANKLIDGINDAINRGGDPEGAGYKVLVNPKTFARLSNDASAYRVLDTSYTSDKFENGFKSLKFYVGDSTAEVISYSCIKEGEAYGLSEGSLARVGAVEMQFGVPENSKFKGPLFYFLQDKNGIGYQCYGNQSIFCKKPWMQVKFTGITN